MGNTYETFRGSYRDPEGFIFFKDDRVFRALSGKAFEEFESVRKTGLLDELVEAKKLVPWKSCNSSIVREASTEIGSNFKEVFEHPKLSFISYPYEWGFSALKCAALFHLNLQIQALKKDVILSDATAYNVQFINTKPIFIDHLSFKPRTPNTLWLAHGQFCEQFLNPLIISSKLGLEFQEIYKGMLEGIPSKFLLKILPWHKKISPNIFFHLYLPKLLDTHINKGKDLSNKYKQKGLNDEKYEKILLGLRDFIESLNSYGGVSTWNNYEQTASYSDEEKLKKSSFIEDFIKNVNPSIIWDMGCNTGYYSQVALNSGCSQVIGFDSDHLCIDQAFSLASNQNQNFLPLIMNLRNPSPNQGWFQREREGVLERRNANAIIALALIHHLRISCNIPLEQVIEFLCSIASEGIIEYVPKGDEKVNELLKFREDIFFDYTSENFERIIQKNHKIIKKQIITSSGRTLYWYKNNSLS